MSELGIKQFGCGILELGGGGGGGGRDVLGVSTSHSRSEDVLNILVSGRNSNDSLGLCCCGESVNKLYKNIMKTDILH